MSEAQFKHITPDMPILGFTGAIGSGCTYLAKGLEEYHHYLRCSLSQPIHEWLKGHGQEATSENLQNAGDFLRDDFGVDCLVRRALQQADQAIDADPHNRPTGLLVDGIRNTGEVNALRAWPYFYLVSVQADQELREQRVLASGQRCKSNAEFRRADARDAGEETEFGQQVVACNYLADVIVLNEEEISGGAKLTRQRYIDRKLYQPYVMLIEHLAKGSSPIESRAASCEALMTEAYVESRRSSCLKRKVGAIIASKDGSLLSAGHNEVPDSVKPCIEDPRYRWCARDVLQETLARGIKFCPKCGTAVQLEEKCKKCEKVAREYVKRCTSCQAELAIKYVCPECKTDVFKQFLPGSDANRTGKLLDMCRALHAEENAILSLSRAGVRLPDHAVLYCTTFPCNLCANKIVAIGIKTIVYAEPYPMEEARRIFESHRVTLKRFEGIKSNAYFRMYS